MNFTKHRVSEQQMLSEMMDYCWKILSHKREADERFNKFSCCISTRSNGLEITSRTKNYEEKLIMVIRYDERNDYYYFVGKLNFGKRLLESRIIIKDKDDFYAYFDYKLSKELCNE